MIRRGIRRGFRRLTRASIITMAGAATGVTLAAIATREGVSKEDAEEMMDGLAAEGVVKKETRNGETVYVTSAANQPPNTSPAITQSAPATSSATTKFCRQCGTSIPVDSKFCEKCGAQL